MLSYLAQVNTKGKDFPASITQAMPQNALQDGSQTRIPEINLEAHQNHLSKSITLSLVKTNIYIYKRKNK